MSEKTVAQLLEQHRRLAKGMTDWVERKRWQIDLSEGYVVTTLMDDGTSIYTRNTYHHLPNWDDIGHDAPDPIVRLDDHTP